MAIWYYVVLDKDSSNFHELLYLVPYSFQLTMEGDKNYITSGVLQLHHGEIQDHHSELSVTGEKSTSLK
jgi:hypothetical protein